MQVEEFRKLVLIDGRAITGGLNNKNASTITNWNFVTPAAICFYNIFTIGNFDACERRVSSVVFSVAVEIAKNNSFGDLLIMFSRGFLGNCFRVLKREGR